VINVSEGRDRAILSGLAEAGGRSLLDLHADPHHHRAVLTLGGPEEDVWVAATAVARRAIAELEIGDHAGAHPRFGVVDVVPWVDLEDPREPTPRSLGRRDRFARWAADELDIPCFAYGPERSLPDVRRQAWRGLEPDHGPDRPHPRAGSCAVGARGVLVAYNLWLAGGGLPEARRVAAAIRRPGLRTLGLLVGEQAQVSCNLTEPWRLGPGTAYDLVAALSPVAGAELVGLVPEEVLHAVPEGRWAPLGLGAGGTIEARLATAGC
jgi:glutamate formiminotransferase